MKVRAITPMVLDYLLARLQHRMLRRASLQAWHEQTVFLAQVRGEIAPKLEELRARHRILDSIGS